MKYRKTIHSIRFGKNRNKRSDAVLHYSTTRKGNMQHRITMGEDEEE